MKQKFANLGIYLNRDFLKQINGGQSCSYVWQDSEGHWHTEHGTCTVYNHGGGGPYAPTNTEAFCKTEHHQHPTPLTSNGGVSRCIG